MSSEARDLPLDDGLHELPGVIQASTEGSLTSFGMTARRARESGFPLRIQPLHVIFHAGFERKLRLITERAPDFVQICLGEVLIVRVGIVDVIGDQSCSEAFV